MGQLDATCTAPPRHGRRGHAQHGRHVHPARVVALQVAFERQTLKPVFPIDRL
jgi:hypothetical protein